MCHRQSYTVSLLQPSSHFEQVEGFLSLTLCHKAQKKYILSSGNSSLTRNKDLLLTTGYFSPLSQNIKVLHWSGNMRLLSAPKKILKMKLCLSLKSMVQYRRGEQMGYFVQRTDLRFRANQNINRSGANNQNKNITEIHRGSGEY